MSSRWGRQFQISIFGESHGAGIGVVIDGVPAGFTLDLEELYAFLKRRAPGRNRASTPRQESDLPELVSGVQDGRTTGAPLTALIRNSDQHSKDYSELASTARPGHADYTGYLRYAGCNDVRGGGHFSGRLTAPLCIAGGIAKQILARRGIFVGAHLQAAAGIQDERFPLYPSRELLEGIGAKAFPVLNDGAGEKMQAAILEAKSSLDSVGGVIECAAVGLPAGLGDPMFEGVENRLAAALFGIPAVKGVEFGEGFHAADLRGSENNDAFVMESGAVRTQTNHAGGILGGITTGMPLILRAAVKPTPSIGREQRTVSLAAGETAALTIHGRHDPCIAHRAVPVVEAVTAMVLLDMLMEGNHGTF